MFSVHSSSSRLFTLLLILAVLSQISQGFTFIIPRSTTSGALSPSSSPLRSTSAARSSPLFSTATHKLDGNPIRGPITPVGNFVVCRVKDVLTTTQGGILLPDQSKVRRVNVVDRRAQPRSLSSTPPSFAQLTHQTLIQTSSEADQAQRGLCHFSWPRPYSPSHWSPHPECLRARRLCPVRQVRRHKDRLRR